MDKFQHKLRLLIVTGSAVGFIGGWGMLAHSGKPVAEAGQHRREHGGGQGLSRSDEASEHRTARGIGPQDDAQPHCHADDIGDREREQHSAKALIGFKSSEDRWQTAGARDDAHDWSIALPIAEEIRIRRRPPGCRASCRH